ERIHRPRMPRPGNSRLGAGQECGERDETRDCGARVGGAETEEITRNGGAETASSSSGSRDLLPFGTEASEARDAETQGRDAEEPEARDAETQKGRGSEDPRPF